MDIGIIGAGRVGVSLGKYLKDNGINIKGFYSKSKNSVSEAALFTDTKSFDSLEEVVTENDILFITTPDDEIINVFKELKIIGLDDKMLAHFSGVLSSEIFKKKENDKFSCCSIHPMYAFSDKFNSYKSFPGTHIVMEGDSKALETLGEIFRNLNHSVHYISSNQKAKYHAAAAMASNNVIALLYSSINLLKQCGFDEISARELLAPLVVNNVKNVVGKGCTSALTGPVERNDEKTVRMHLDALEGHFSEKSYIETAKLLVDIAKEKNPDREYIIDELLK